MKTIITTLPIYDNIAKQCYERSKHSGNGIVPIICPRHRLPSFQWLDGTDGAASVSKIELLGEDNLNNLNNLFDHWVNTSFLSFVSSGLDIINAEQTTGHDIVSLYDGSLYYHQVVVGSTVTITGNFHQISGVAPHIIVDDGSGGGIEIINTDLIEGINTFNYTSIYTGKIDLRIYGTHGAGTWSFTGVSVKLDSINSYFAALPVLAHDYFVYNGATLLSLLPVGLYYLKITMNTGFIYYSEWFKVDCVYENLITEITNGDYETFTKSGLSIISAINTGATGAATSQYFDVILGEKITVMFNLVLNSGVAPTILLSDVTFTHQDFELSVSGLNVIELTAPYTGQMRIVFYNSANTSYNTSEIYVIRDYSTKYLTVNFTNSCDLGDILYHEGFTQSLYFESKTLEPNFPLEEEGKKNGEGRFVRTFGRQVKKYVAHTVIVPDYMVDVFNRLKLHDTIELIDLVGDSHTLYNLEVEHEWQYDDKFYALVTLTFDYDETVIVSGCCTNIA